jgi:hypothetical protein
MLLHSPVCGLNTKPRFSVTSSAPLNPKKWSSLRLSLYATAWGERSAGSGPRSNSCQPPSGATAVAGGTNIANPDAMVL